VPSRPEKGAQLDSEKEYQLDSVKKIGLEEGAQGSKKGHQLGSMKTPLAQRKESTASRARKRERQPVSHAQPGLNTKSNGTRERTSSTPQKKERKEAKS